jgi:hypothetical protein
VATIHGGKHPERIRENTGKEKTIKECGQYTYTTTYVHYYILHNVSHINGIYVINLKNNIL